MLAKLGAAVRTVSSGIIGRLGGEEFCLLESCDLGDAVEIAENIRRTIKALRFTQHEPFGITCSSGVAEWESGDTIDRILRRADMAMYEAKNKAETAWSQRILCCYWSTRRMARHRPDDKSTQAVKVRWLTPQRGPTDGRELRQAARAARICYGGHRDANRMQHQSACLFSTPRGTAAEFDRFQSLA